MNLEHNDIIFNTIDNGIIILDKELNIIAWNNWLEIRTNIKAQEIVNKNICEEFSYINEKKLKRKIKSVLITQNASYYSVDPHQYLIDIRLHHIINKVYTSMLQDITIVPYDIEKGEVCLYIYDKTSLYETNYKLEKLNNTLKNLSNRDPMTHSYNRRYFNEISKKQLALSLRNEHSLSLAVIDIDKFKNINDTYGHAIGDDVIILLAKHLEKNIRSSDICARFGGEEFVLLFYNSPVEDTYKITENIRKKIEQLEVQTSKGILNFTVSIGIAQYKDDKDSKSIEKTIIRADDALYIAKNSGRNQVKSAD